MYFSLYFEGAILLYIPISLGISPNYQGSCPWRTYVKSLFIVALPDDVLPTDVDYLMSC